ncbi:MAG: hypothetical protein KF773_24620 [Deltaproteobacteria bacterium]|nr:hypothetical protein [Deltaproteobacteria bacterium]MCW5806482.1 hypothetical protein [Deltaproteobacteria bacterium]
MFATRVYHYRDPAAVILGLKELRKQGLTPRGLLFVALDPRGETYIAVPEDLDAVASIRVGDKLSLVPPFEGRYFHFDAVHRLPGSSLGVLWNGDRRLGDTGSAPEVACAISEWLKGSSAKNVFLGCAPHVPGAYWSLDHLSAVTDLHSLGFLDCVVTATGILARKIDDPRLFHLEFQALAQHRTPTDGWQDVFRSEMGNILLIERRVLQYRLVLTCERGLVEIDVSHLPDLVIETARVPMRSGFGVVGRIDGGAFAVTAGTIEPWGLTNMSPAMLVGSPTESLLDLPRTLRAMPLE